MRKSFIKFFCLLTLITAALLFAGCSGGKDFTSYNKEYEKTVSEISLKLDVSDIAVKKTEGDKILLHYYDTEESFYSIKEEGGVLSVSRASLGELQENIRFGVGMKKYYKVTLSLPEGYNGTVKLETTSGDISVKEINAENETFTVKSESGDVRVENVSFSSLSVDGTSSEIVLKKINASDINASTVAGEVLASNLECAKYTVKGEAADVDVKDSSIGQASVNITTGNVYVANVKIGSTVGLYATSGDIRAEGLDAGICTMTSKSGDIFLENLWIGTSIYLISDSGDITATISDPVTDFTIDSVSEYGKNNLDGVNGLGGFKTVTARNVTGDISIKFAG